MVQFLPGSLLKSKRTGFSCVCKFLQCSTDGVSVVLQCSTDEAKLYMFLKNCSNKKTCFFSDIREQGASSRYVISGVSWFIGDVAVGWSGYTSDSNNWLTVTGQSLLINIWILFVRTTQSLRSRLWEERRWPQGKVCSYYPNNELNTRMKTSEGSLKFDQGFRSSLNRCGWFYKGDKSSNKCITDVISCPDAVLSVHPAWMWLFLVGDCWIILFEYSHALPPSWKVLERPNVRGW